MNERDHESESRDPAADGAAGEAVGEEGAGDEEVPSGPAPATWAGRQRSTSKEAGEHDQLAADQPEPEVDAGEEEPVNAVEPGDADGGGEEGATGDTAERLSQDTVEANTLALGDREAAREAALKGLRARAAQHASKTGTEAITAPPPKAPQPTEAEADGGQPPPKAPPAPVTPAEETDEGPPKRGLWARFAAGSLLIIVAMATATALSLLVFLNGVLADFHGLNSVRDELTVAHPGDPQTILILGSDKRPGEGKAYGARSDTTILLRIASDQITVLSIPRDLKVNIPGYGIDKFNAAYTLGGADLTIKVVKQLTGITDINHVVNVNFTGFADAVNAIGCVYVDVDRHYYHSNVGLAPTEQYAEIDIPAGYQRMCGYNALQYVRYRHDDNDLVRSARQQEFLREMRQELPASRILGEYKELVDILHKYVTLDIRENTDLIALGELIVSARDAPVVQVHFPANLGGPTATYVTASESAIKEAVAKFEGVTPTQIPGESSEGSGSGGGSSGGGSGSGGSGSGGSSEAPAPPPLIDATTSAQESAANLAATKQESGKPMLDFPVYYPTKLAPDSTVSAVSPARAYQPGADSRAFPIDGPGDEVYHGYKMVVSMPTDGYTGYYGVSGTDWKEPPILEHPDETRTIDGREYLLSWDGPQLRLIGWKTDEATYWVDNTLLNVLTPGQMFGIAESMQKYTG
jgi:polyisoprenyl-teichoic acid--peptidoglycan teichoic acid transferase